MNSTHQSFHYYNTATSQAYLPPVFQSFQIANIDLRSQMSNSHLFHQLSHCFYRTASYLALETLRKKKDEDPNAVVLGHSLVDLPQSVF